MRRVLPSRRRPVTAVPPARRHRRVRVSSSSEHAAFPARPLPRSAQPRGPIVRAEARMARKVRRSAGAGTSGSPVMAGRGAKCLGARPSALNRHGPEDPRRIGLAPHGRRLRRRPRGSRKITLMLRTIRGMEDSRGHSNLTLSACGGWLAGDSAATSRADGRGRGARRHQSCAAARDALVGDLRSRA